MRIAYGVSLDTVGAVPDDIREKLEQLNINTAEEVVAMAAVEGSLQNLAQYLGISPAEVETHVNSLKALMPDRVAAEMEQPFAESYGLGAIEPPPGEWMTSAGPFETSVDPSSLPSTVNYISLMNPIRNQGPRGTCVSFACTALGEYYQRKYHNTVLDLSEQCLYKRCKENDGAPSAEGTWVNVGISCLVKFGEALESCEPYNPNLPTNQPGAHPACCVSGAAQYKLGGSQQLNARSALDIKGALASGSVVAFAIPVFRSWYESAAVRQSGNINLPLPGDPRVGGHAMLFVGYQDDATTPGGGYFILRNSWGASWGAKSPYGAGYGTLPYKYMADNGNEAYISDRPITSELTPLYRYWHGQGGDHFYTTDWNELGTGKYGWAFEGIQCYVYTTAKPNTVPLYRYWNGQACDHFYTTNWTELGSGKDGWAFEGIQCYVHPTQQPGSLPLYRYWNPQCADHFYTTSWSELGSGKYGWVFERVQCYVFSQPKAAAGTEETAGTTRPATFTLAEAASAGGGTPPASFPAPGSAPSESAIPATFTVAAGGRIGNPGLFQGHWRCR